MRFLTTFLKLPEQTSLVKAQKKEKNRCNKYVIINKAQFKVSQEAMQVSHRAQHWGSETDKTTQGTAINYTCAFSGIAFQKDCSEKGLFERTNKTQRQFRSIVRLPFSLVWRSMAALNNTVLPSNVILLF